MRKGIRDSLFLLNGMAAACIAAGLPHHMDVTSYHLADRRIHKPVKIGVLADLHCRSFGSHQSRIMKVMDQEKPDLVIIPGDLFDKGRNYQNAFDLVDGLREYPVYFTSGNHDRHLWKDIYKLRDELQKRGVHVLEDEEEVFQKGDTFLEIAGCTDHGHAYVLDAREFNQIWKTENYRILISHRPDYRSFYAETDCDLIICGHNHGGQWRIPLTHQGIYAPGDGLFPKYTEGVHNLNGRKMVISRGLATGAPGIPRLYNNPEIVFINLEGESV